MRVGRILVVSAVLALNAIALHEARVQAQVQAQVQSQGDVSLLLGAWTINKDLSDLGVGPAGRGDSRGGGGRGGGGGNFGGGGGAGGTTTAVSGATAFGVPVPGEPRVILKYPSDGNDILLSGGLVGGEALVNRPVVVDSPLGSGHVVIFTNRPFWRFQTHGNFFLAFNAILNWNDLNAK